MGAAYFIALEHEISGFDQSMDGKGLSLTEEQLNSAAAALQVRPLMDFFSVDAANAAEFLDEEYEVEEIWFTPSEGLATVRALLTHFAANPSTLPFQEFVLNDLSNMERILAMASKHSVRWCLHLDI